MGILKKERKNKVRRQHGFEDLWCSKCKDPDSMYRTRSDVIDYICGMCIAIDFYTKELKKNKSIVKEKKEKLNYPRGWHRRKRFESDDGKVYEFGKLVEN